ncbi:MAG: hypothetical protein CMB73_05800 [Euryarchaeota archaeon]|nr:hypothetical protein [Euryarchaeota archaeon]
MMTPVVQAASVGSGQQAARAILRTEYKEELDMFEAKNVARKVLEKTMDCVNLTSEKIEMLYLSREPISGNLSTEHITL